LIILDASVALKWFAEDEPRTAAALQVLESVGRNPEQYIVPEIFMAECLAVLCRMRGATVDRLREALTLMESLGIERAGCGHELMQTATEYAISWSLSGYDAIYVALAALTDGVWLTADARAARRVREKRFVRLLA
jgi:predicted nucleic acid-binding protein